MNTTFLEKNHHYYGFANPWRVTHEYVPMTFKDGSTNIVCNFVKCMLVAAEVSYCNLYI